MPVHRATKNGKSGWQWGSSGKVYTGPGAQARAAAQGRAAHAAKYKSMTKHQKGRK
jgi:hypothetical protein